MNAQPYGMIASDRSIHPGGLAIRVGRRLGSHDVIDTLSDATIRQGIPEHIRSGNGPEFVAKNLRKWLEDAGSKTLYIERGSPWENGYCESFNSKLRDEFLNGEIFYSLKETQILCERWRVHYNTVRPHSSLGYRPPAPEAWQAEINNGCGDVETATRFPSSPDPRLRRDYQTARCATLTIYLAHSIGHANPRLSNPGRD
jgi:putative transposase